MYRSFLSDFEKDSILETESRENLKITSRTRPFESLAGLLLALTTRFPRQRSKIENLNDNRALSPGRALGTRR